MALTLVQDTGRGSGTNSFTRQFASTPTAGNVLIFYLSWIAASGNTVDVDVTDDSGAITWHSAVLSSNEGGCRVKIVYAYNLPSLGANPTITVTRQGSVSTVIQGSVQEWSGFGAADPLNVTASHIGGQSSTAVSGTTGTTSEPNALVVSVVNKLFFGGAITVESVSPAWTQEWETTSSSRAEADYRVITSTGTQSCSWTFAQSDFYAACIAVFVDVVDFTAPRVTQVVQSVAAIADSVIRGTQVVQSVVVHENVDINLTQVVQTLVVINPVPETPPVILTPTNTNQWKLLRFDLKKREEEEA